MPDDGRQIVRVTNQELQTMRFDEALEHYMPDLATALPDHIPLDRFKRVVLTAVNQNPDLARADRRSLFNSCSRCAHDGLYPDGREAALVVFRTKVKRKVTNESGDLVDREVYVDLVQYLPMVAGIRKRMRNTGEVLSADAQVVCRADKFHYEFGDDPNIEHKPPPLDAERGETIGSYAIIKLVNGEVLREVMSRQQIERVRAMSRAKDGPAWAKSWDEMARKTVLKRCAKAAPTGAELERLLGRDEELPHAHADSPFREIPPRPQPEDYLQIENGGDVEEESDQPEQDETRFEATDLFGEAHECATEEDAIEAVLGWIGEARSLRVLEGLTESNPVWAQYPSIIEAFKEQKETFKNPGNGQDRPGTGAQPTDPARGAASLASKTRDGGNPQRQTEHPEGETQHPNPGERSTTQELPAARAATPAATTNPPNESPRDEPKPSTHAPRDEKFWSQKQFVLPGKTAKELLYYTQEYLRQCRDQIDVNGIESDNATRYQEELSASDRKAAEVLIDLRRKEIG